MKEIGSQQCIVTIIVLGPEGNDNKVAYTSNGTWYANLASNTMAPGKALVKRKGILWV